MKKIKYTISWVLLTILFMINAFKIDVDFWGAMFIVFFIGYGYATRMFHEEIEKIFPTNKNDIPPNSGELEK